jgi:hypothetical protein
MFRRLYWALLVVVGMMIGSMIGSYQRPQAMAADGNNDEVVAQNAAILAQLKDINAQLKDMNGFLHNGTVKTIAVMNPDR